MQLELTNAAMDEASNATGATAMSLRRDSHA
jgi:hypothetical protein